MKHRKVLKNVRMIVLCMIFLIGIDLKADDIDVLKSRLIESYISTGGSGGYLSSQSSNGSWSDIDYSSRHKTTWAPLKHVQRLKSMSVAYNNPSNSYYKNSSLLNGIISGIEYWFARAPKSDNWWFNDIGQQQQLGPTLILMQDDIAKDLVDKGCALLKDPYLTALNLVDVSEQTIHRGILTNNKDDVLKGLDAIGSTVLVSDGDGIKSDYSFHQHEKQLYNGGYGLEFIDDITYWIHITKGLSLSMGQEEINTYSNYLLDGMQWMTYKSSLDFSIVGRGISRKNKIPGTGGIKNTLNKMSELEDEFSEDYKSYSRHIDGGSNSLIGNKHFWKSDYHVHRRNNYFTSVRMCSKRTLASETMNGENPKAYYLAYGAMAVQVDHDEYSNIFPVWDWCRIPGVTSPLMNNPSTMPSWWSNYGKTSFVGGVSDGMFGVSAMDLNMDNVYGKKAWFFFEDEIVALGAGINSSRNNPIVTSINQTKLSGEVVSYESGQKVYAKGDHTLNNPDWVFHNKVLYSFPEEGNVRLKNNTQSGSWSEINSQYSYSNVYQDVFSLWVEHGVKPSNASYHYIVTPGINKDNINGYINNSSIKVVTNTSNIQAVTNNSLKLTGIVFYQAGDLEIHDNISISADKPCILLLDEENGRISASNPNQTSLNLNLNISYADNTSEEVIFNFQAGDLAGKTMQKQLKIADVIPCNGFSVLGQVINEDKGLSNGSVSLEVSDGVAPYTYQWKDGAQVKDRVELQTDTFEVTVIDANNCEEVQSFIVGENSIEVTNIEINDQTLSVSYTTTGNCSNVKCYIYNDTKALIYSSTENVESGFSVNMIDECPSCEEGSYDLKLSCGNNISSQVFNYTLPIDLCENFSVEGQLVHCDVGQANGSIVLVSSGGKEPYEYNWTDVSENNSIRTGLIVGKYIVTVQDDNDCVLEKSYLIKNKETIEEPVKIEIISHSSVTRRGEARIDYTSSKNESVLVELRDENDKVVKSFMKSSYNDRDNTIILDLKEEEDGEYTVIIHVEGEENPSVKVKKEKEDIPIELIGYYPNPTTGLVAFEYKSSIQQAINVQVINQDDEVVDSFIKNAEAGNNKLMIDLSEYENGDYIVLVELHEEEFRVRITKY